MKKNKGFVKNRLAQYVAASLIAVAGSQALANDFSINNGQLTISNGTFSQTVTVGSNGILESVNNVPASNSFGIPNFSFDLVNSATTPTNGTYTFKVGVAISSDTNSNRRFEAFIGNLTLNINGSTVTGTIPANQNLIVIARDGAVNATAVVSNNSAANGPVSISGGSVTFSGSNLVNRLTSANAAFQTILNAFDAGGQYTFRVVMEQTSGSPSNRFGRVVNNTFNAFPRVQTSCEAAPSSQLGGDSGVFRLLGTVNNSNYRINEQFSLAYAVQGKFGVGQSASTATLSTFTETCAVDTGGSGGGNTGGGNTGGGTVVVDEQTLNQQNEVVDNLSNAIDQVINTGGEASQDVINQARVATNAATNNIISIGSNLAQGGTVDTSNLLNTVLVASKAGSTGATVATATPNGDAKQEQLASSRFVLSATANVLATLASQTQSGSTPALSATQVTQVKTATTNLLSTASTLSTQSSSTSDIRAAAAAAAQAINANRRLNVAADTALVTAVSNASAQIATAAIRAVAGANVSEAEITTLLQQNQGLAEQVLNLALPIPPAVVETSAERQQKVNNAQATASLNAVQRARLADATRDNFVVPTSVVVNGVNILDRLRNLFRGRLRSRL